MFFGADKAAVWFTGVVEDRIDPEMLGRVRVRIWGLHSKERVPNERTGQGIPVADLPWAFVMRPTTTASMDGIGTSPHGLVEGSWVIGISRDGEAMNDLVVIGSLGGFATDPPQDRNGRYGFVDPRTGDEISSSPRKINPEEVRDPGYPQQGIPMGRYPQEAFLGEQDVNRLARGDKLDSTIIKSKKDKKERSIPTASGKAWSELESPAAPKYPYNHVTESESGHIFEMDDTPGTERVALFHRKGTWFEIHPDGSFQVRVEGDDFSVSMKDKKYYAAGNFDITSKGNIGILATTGNVKLKTMVGNIEAEALIGNISATAIAGAIALTAGLGVSVTAGGPISLTSATSILLAAPSISIGSTGSMSMSSGGSMSMASGGSTSMVTGGAMEASAATMSFMTPGSAVHVNPGAVSAVSGPSSTTISPTSIISFASGNTTTMDPTGTTMNFAVNTLKLSPTGTNVLAGGSILDMAATGIGLSAPTGAVSMTASSTIAQVAGGAMTSNAASIVNTSAGVLTNTAASMGFTSAAGFTVASATAAVTAASGISMNSGAGTLGLTSAQAINLDATGVLNISSAAKVEIETIELDMTHPTLVCGIGWTAGGAMTIASNTAPIDIFSGFPVSIEGNPLTLTGYP